MQSRKNTETKFQIVQTADGPVMVPYVIRRSNRSRRIYIGLDKLNQALLTVPSRGTIKAALEFLSQCGDWVVDQIAKSSRPITILEYLLDQPYLSLNGVRLPVKFAFTNRCPFCDFEEGAVEVVLKYDPHADQDGRIREALKGLAKRWLTKRLKYLCEIHSIPPPSRVTVRDQSSRWGSCSCSQEISLNWRLILLSAGLQDYVILHELAHLQEMNHSSSFWDLLGRYDSRSKKHDEELKEVGRRIIGLGKPND